MANLKVLIVDDDRDIADTLAYIIKRSGYDVSVAYDGETAIRMAHHQSFDCAFMDMMLPGINGAQSLAQIKQAQPDIRAYMMTGYSDKDCKSQALHSGAVEILHKPIMPEDVLGKLCQESSGTILIADDDPIFAEIISSTLETAGWTVRTAQTGLQAVDITSHGGISALVLDIEMPGLGGVEVCAELRRRGIELPIIVATSSEDGRRLLDQYDICGFLTKPVDPREILDFVERSLRIKSKDAA